MYWKYKNAGSTKVWSGFKIWPDNGGSAWYASEPVEMEYVFQELGFTNPNAGSEEATTSGEGDDMDMADSEDPYYATDETYKDMAWMDIGNGCITIASAVVSLVVTGLMF